MKYYRFLVGLFVLGLLVGLLGPQPPKALADGGGGDGCVTYQVTAEHFIDPKPIQLYPGSHTISVSTPVWVVAMYETSEAGMAKQHAPLIVNGIEPRSPYAYYDGLKDTTLYTGWSDFPPLNYPDTMWSKDGAVLSTWILDDVPPSQLPIKYSVTVC